MLDRKAGLFHEPQKCLKVGWLLFQRRNDGKPYPLLGRERLFSDPLTVVEETALAMELGIEDHGQVIFQTYPVRQPTQRKAGADEIMVLAGAIVGCGIVIDVVVDMSLVDMGTDKELILALCPAHSGFIADPVGLLRGYFSRLERLAYLEEQRPTVSLPACFGLVLAMHQQELRMCRGMVAKVRGHRSQLFRIAGIFKALLHGLDSTLIRSLFVWLYVGCGRSNSSYFMI